MSFPKYPEYKYSEFEWLGQIPSHWIICSVRMLFTLGRGRVISHEEISDNPGDYPVYSSQTENNGEMGKIGSYDFDGEHITWTTDGANAGTVFKRSGKFNCTNVCGTLKPTHDDVDLKYFSNAIGISTNAFVRQDINPKLMNNVMAGIRVPFPPLLEQSAIAAFLDRETAKIDALVAEQEKLIELLKEKRQAVISHAVTKGLDPNVPMKDSGVEWLGEVPEHWGLVPLKWFSRCASGENTSSILVEPEDNGELFPIIGGNGVMGYGPSSNINKTVIIIGRVGALCGNIHLIKEKAWITDNALILDASSTMFDHEFLTFLLKARNLNEIASKTAQPLITGTQVRDQRIPTPPIDEQVKIVDYLKHQLSTFDSLIQESQRAIDLLKERRAALISAAVTGKIDVRGLTEAML